LNKRNDLRIKKGANHNDLRLMGRAGPELFDVTNENNDTYENSPNHRWPDSGTDFDFCPELAEIIDRWESLSEHIKAAVMALVDSAKE